MKQFVFSKKAQIETNALYVSTEIQIICLRFMEFKSHTNFGLKVFVSLRSTCRMDCSALSGVYDLSFLAYDYGNKLHHSHFLQAISVNSESGSNVLWLFMLENTNKCVFIQKRLRSYYFLISVYHCTYGCHHVGDSSLFL